MENRECEVLIIKPADQKNVYGGLDQFQLTAYEPPFWSALLAGVVREKGYKVQMLDTEVAGKSINEISDYINELNPFLVVFSVSGTNPSASTQNMLAVHKILVDYRNRYGYGKTKFLAHGIHVSALPEKTIKEEMLDFVCIGEGFDTIVKLAEAAVNEVCDTEMIEQVPNLCYMRENEVRFTFRSGVCQNLDELPMAAWDLLPMEKYRAHNWHCFGNISGRQPYGVIWTALGCPFHCHFCCINTMFGKSGIRFRSVEKVIEEIDYLVENYHIRNLKIVDELFALNENRVVDFCERLIERNYSLNIWAYARVDTVTPKMLFMMKKAGINWIAYGFESGNKNSLDDVNKGYALNKVDQVVVDTYKEGLYIIANYMFGLPEDDYAAMQETLNMAIGINSEWVNFNTVMAYPGSGLYQDALANGARLPRDWQGYSQYAKDSMPMDTKKIKAEEVIAFRDYAFHTYFSNPRYLSKMMKFGEDTVQHILNMTKYKLPRNNAVFCLK